MKRQVSFKKLFGKRSNRGFTLVEVVISTILLGLLVVGVVAFSSPIFSMISQNEKNARATFLAESINTYLTSTLKQANKVAVIENIFIDELWTKDSMNALIEANPALKDLKDTNSAKEEIRCIGIRWVFDEKADQKSPGCKFCKLIITDEAVQKNENGPTSLTYEKGWHLVYPGSVTGVTATTKVFDDALYDGVYPVVKVEPLKQLPPEDEPDKEMPNESGYKITTAVYSSYKCYNRADYTEDPEKRDGPIAFTGVSYIDLPNLKGPAPDNIKYRSIQEDMNDPYGPWTFTANGAKYRYPSTYIFYSVVKSDI